MTPEERILWLNAFEEEYEDDFATENWFNSVEGFILASRDDMRRGNWLSWADAGAIFAIQEGMEVAQGQEVQIAAVESAANAWAAFFRSGTTGGEQATSARERRIYWGRAEQLGVEFGVGVATLGGISPTYSDLGVFAASELYRAGLRHPNRAEEAWSHLCQVCQLTGSEIGPALDPRLTSVSYWGATIIDAAIGPFGNVVAW